MNPLEIVESMAANRAPPVQKRRPPLRQVQDIPATPALAWPPLQAIGPVATPRPEAFPFAALGAILGAAAASIAADVQAPDALAGGSVLAAASLAVQPLANVILPHGQRAPLSLFVITGAGSGDRKSATDAVACQQIDEVRKQQARDHVVAMQQWESENQSRKKSDPAPPAPAPQVLTTSNATIEGICKLLKFQSSIGVFSAEGGEMLGGHSLRDERRMSGLSFFLKAWGAEALDSLRGGEGLTVLLGRRMALHVLVQPVLLSQLLADPLAQGQGLLARCLIAQPETLAGTRLFKHCNPHDSPAVQHYNARMRELLAQRPTLWGEGDGYELKPNDLYLSPEAQAMWIAFYDQVEQAQSPDGDLCEARAFSSKAAEHAARMAGVIAIVEESPRIEPQHMQGGIELASFYLSEHLRLTGAGREQQHNKMLTTLLEWLQERGALVTKAELLQKSPRMVRALKAAGIAALMAELAERGYVRGIDANTWEVRRV